MAGKIKDRTGQKFGKWTIVEYKGNKKWLCRCDCGTESLREITNIAHGQSNQCTKCQWKSITIDNYNDPLPEAIWNKMLLQARRREIEFSVTREEGLKLFQDQKGKCALTGLDLLIAKNPRDYRNNLQTASLDRINSNIPYSSGNLQWIHKKINLMKNVLSQEEFINFCTLVANYNKNETNMVH